MQTTRREMLKVGLSGLSLVSIGSTIPAFLTKFAYAESPAASSISDDNILVVVQLSGGNDGLNTVVPVGNDAYLKARPQIGIKQRLHRLNDDLSLNPGMTAFKDMFDQGQLAIVNGCGYPNPNRSHFESMAIWHAADPVNGQHGGWLGHYLDHIARGTNNLTAVNIGTELPQALVNDSAPVPSIQSIDEYRLRTDPGTQFDAKLEEQIIRDLNTVRDSTPAMQFLARQATNAIISSEQIRKLTSGYKPDAEYPQNLGQKLRFIAQIIAGNFGTKLFYCEIGGFDTHANQVNQHEQLLGNVASSIQTFLKDLGAKGLADKVVVMCFSEFGRRVNQNDSAGTDHGAAAPMFVAGTKVRGGLYGEYPSLAQLEGGDLKYTTDFRRVYATMLDRWLNADSAQVLGNRFEPLAFLGGTDTNHPSTAPAESPHDSSPTDSPNMMDGGGMMMQPMMKS
jgi:uncharacterized protein (DUF1501 family)